MDELVCDTFVIVTQKLKYDVSYGIAELLYLINENRKNVFCFLGGVSFIFFSIQLFSLIINIFGSVPIT